MYHYCYKLELKESGEYYFGSRTSKVEPKYDNYMGSMKTWKPNKSKLIKTILKSDFLNREECILYERNLILTCKDDFLNKNVSIPGVGFNTLGLGQYVDLKGKVFRVEKNDELVLNGTLKPFWAGKRHTKESREKMSKSAIGKKMSDESKKKLSEYHTNRPKSEETKKKMSESSKGENNNYSKYLKKTGLCHHNSKSVGQYDLNGDLIKKWDNCSIASKELGLNYKAVNACVIGKSKTSGGFIWKYEK